MASLFDDCPPPETGPYRASNTAATRQAAAREIAPSAATLRGQVLRYVASRGDDGASDEEIQDALGMAGNTERPRRQECEDRYLIVDSGRTRPTHSGRQAVCWVATLAGRLAAGRQEINQPKGGE